MELIAGVVVVCIGVGMLLFVRYYLEIPFPWSVGFHSPPPANERVLTACFLKLDDGGTLDMVMGEMNSQICASREVIQAARAALAKDVRIRIVNGPIVDKGSWEFLRLLDNPRVVLFKHDPRPTDHFRVLNGRKVFLEPTNHPQFTYTGFAELTSRRVAREFTGLFEQVRNESTECSVEDFELKSRDT